MPVTNSAHRGSQSAAPVRKSARRGSQSAAPVMKSARRGSASAVPATKSALRGSKELRRAPATKSTLRGSQSAVLATKSRSPSAAPATKSAIEPRVQKLRFTAPVTKPELLDDHHHVQSAAPATKTACRIKTAPIPWACHEKSNLKHENMRFPLRLPRKVTIMRGNARDTTTRAQSLEAPAQGTQTF